MQTKCGKHTSSPAGEAFAHVVGATYTSATTRIWTGCLRSNEERKSNVKSHGSCGNDTATLKRNKQQQVFSSSETNGASNFTPWVTSQILTPGS